MDTAGQRWVPPAVSTTIGGQMDLSLDGTSAVLRRGLAGGLRGGAELGRLPSPLRTMGVAVLLGLAADALFYGKSLGISFPLFVGLFVAALFGVARLDGVQVMRRNLWLLAPLGFFATMV